MHMKNIKLTYTHTGLYNILERTNIAAIENIIEITSS